MLEYLRIQNLALIEDMSLEFSGGINVLSGETGAGKSFILKALNFLLGERLTSDLVRPGKEKAVVEALFSTPAEDLAIRREFVAENGRSRLFINDRLSSQESVRELRSALLLHTSQHGQQKLLQPAFQAQILDDFLKRPELLAERDNILKQLLALAEQAARLREKAEDLESKRELLEFQRQEIDKVNPREGEEEELETARAALRAKENATAAVDQALEILHGPEGRYGLIESVGALEKALRQLNALNDGFSDELRSVEEFYPALRDLSSRLRRNGNGANEEEDVEAIERRLFALAQLKRKLRRPLEEILTLKREIEENLSFLDSCRLDLMQLKRREKELCLALDAVLARLNPARKEAAKDLSALLEAELRELGFSEHVSVEFVFTPRRIYVAEESFGENGKPENAENETVNGPLCLEEKPQLFWRPNPGQTAQPLERIASGGELSRFLLAVVSLMSSREDDAPTLIFDEVDAGVGGMTLNKVAEKLLRLGETRQILLITHWPKLAGTARNHFFVEKVVRNGETFTLCTRLDTEGKAKELLRMSGESGG